MPCGLVFLNTDAQKAQAARTPLETELGRRPDGRRLAHRADSIPPAAARKFPKTLPLFEQIHQRP